VKEEGGAVGKEPAAAARGGGKMTSAAAASAGADALAAWAPGKPAPYLHVARTLRVRGPLRMRPKLVSGAARGWGMHRTLGNARFGRRPRLHKRLHASAVGAGRFRPRSPCFQMPGLVGMQRRLDELLKHMIATLENGIRSFNEATEGEEKARAPLPPALVPLEMDRQAAEQGSAWQSACWPHRQLSARQVATARHSPARQPVCPS